MRRIAALALLALLALIVGPLIHYHAGPAAYASTRPDILLNQKYQFQNVQTGGWMRTAVSGGAVYDSSGATTWYSQNLHNTRFVQLRALATNNHCIWYNPSTQELYTKTCSTASGYDYWWLPTSSLGGNTAWIIPFNATDRFATDGAAFGEGPDVYAAFAGDGNYAVWAYSAV